MTFVTPNNFYETSKMHLFIFNTKHLQHFFVTELCLSKQNVTHAGSTTNDKIRHPGTECGLQTVLSVCLFISCHSVSTGKYFPPGSKICIQIVTSSRPIGSQQLYATTCLGAPLIGGQIKSTHPI